MWKQSQVQDVFGRSGQVFTVPATQTVRQAAEKMNRSRIGCLVAVDPRGAPVGILTERDILRKIVARSLDPDQTVVRQIMSPKIVSCELSTSITRAQQLMAQHEIRHLPIMEGGRLLGMISSRDILSYQLSSVEAIVRRQSRMLNELEQQHPGITELQRDARGRVVI
jgi:CBS domain-containing protein